MPVPVRPKYHKLSNTLRHVTAMLVVMWGLGLLPVFALMRVPARTGAMRHETITGAPAEQHLQAKMAENRGRRAAYQKAIERLKAKGLKRTAVVVARAHPELDVRQTALRRLAELVVPTLYAKQGYSELILDDWSGYNQYYDGTAYVSDGWSRDVMMLVSFNKDPETQWASASAEALWWSGWEPDPEASDRALNGGAFRDRVTRVARRMSQVVYPTLDAETMSRSWWDRLNDWAVCTVTGCSTAATACFISNVWNAEVAWAPCFIAWCGGAEVGCAVYAIIH